MTAREEGKPDPHADRCEVCDWPLAESRDKGCVPGDCSYRPDDPAEQARLRERREQIAARKHSQEANVPPDALDLAQELYEFAPAMSRGEKITWDMLPSGTGLREHILGLARHILAKYDLRAKQ